MIPHPIVIDDFFPTDTVDEIIDEFKSREFTHVTPATNYRFSTSQIDYTISDRESSPTLREFDKVWTRKDVQTEMRNHYNYATQMLVCADIDYTQLRLEGKDDECSWHKNDYARVAGQLVLCTWLYYLKPKDNYTGGEFEYSFENIPQSRTAWDPIREPKETIKIDNKHNRMVIVPSFFWHRVNPIKFKTYENIYDGRYSVNGHIGFNLQNQNSLKGHYWDLDDN